MSVIAALKSDLDFREPSLKSFLEWTEKTAAVTNKEMVKKLKNQQSWTKVAPCHTMKITDLGMFMLSGWPT